MNLRRITRRFEELAAQRTSGFVAYVTAGDPSTEATLAIAHALESAGVDILELGIPFSDPLADGPVIQAASSRALAGGMTVSGSLEIVRRFRTSSELPLVLFTYLNPIYVYGFERFLSDAVKAGADGLLILDLPPDEAEQNAELVSSGGLDPIRLISPTTAPERMAKIVSTGRGFIYYVSREGVTGEQSRLSESISAQVAEVRRHTSLPIAVGFGISTTEQASTVARQADAVVVGSALVRQIAENRDSADLAMHIRNFVRPLVRAVKSA
ncbi:MAG TPA: tryptophan synthase subunit alpha [Terrimicrobiaceae bacterium]